MKKRLLKKHNAKLIHKILSPLKEAGFNIENIRFGSGYFVFSFDQNSIAWFWLKELPDWKFGIWLVAPRYQRTNRDGIKYRVFGEHKWMIDKFKPSASALSETKMDDFIRELHTIHFLTEKDRYKSDSDFNLISEILEEQHQSFIDWREYLIDAEESKQEEFEKERINQLLFDTILKKEKEFIYPFQVKTIDRNANGKWNISPRYETNVYFDNNFEMTDDEYYSEVIDIFEQLCLATSEIEVPEDLWIETFLFEPISESIMSPNRFNEQEAKYGRPQNTFEKNIERQRLYYKSYPLDDKIGEILESWYSTNYPDTPTVTGYMDCFQRIYEGQFNPLNTPNRINNFLRKKEKERKE